MISRKTINTINRNILLFFLTFTCVDLAYAGKSNNFGIEVGDVAWGRDYHGALELSRQNGKPVLVLFQEVPGCIGCQNFGQEVLTHPLLVEAIEDLFIPILVFNNRAGKDAELLQQFGEPSWNFQVIRFLDRNGNDIIPRKDKVWSVSGLAQRMITVLEKYNLQVPLYLKAIALENDEGNIGLAGFAMACFWTGEYKLGKIEGVVSTEAGWYDNREITLVHYHNNKIDLPDLVQQAEKERCAQAVYTNQDEGLERSRFTIKGLHLDEYKVAAPTDQKKQIQQWLNRQSDLDLTPMQLMKINAYMPDDPEYAFKWLSPRQQQRLQK